MNQQELVSSLMIIDLFKQDLPSLRFSEEMKIFLNHYYSKISPDFECLADSQNVLKLRWNSETQDVLKTFAVTMRKCNCIQNIPKPYVEIQIFKRSDSSENIEDFENVVDSGGLLNSENFQYFWDYFNSA